MSSLLHLMLLARCALHFWCIYFGRMMFYIYLGTKCKADRQIDLITLRCMVRLGLMMSWPSRFLLSSAIFNANNPLKNVSSEFELLCKKTEPQAAPRVVLSTIYSSFAYKVACFSPIFSHLIAKGHVKCCSLREQLPLIFEQFKLILISSENS